MTEKRRADGAGLIGQVASPIAGTEPRLSTIQTARAAAQHVVDTQRPAFSGAIADAVALAVINRLRLECEEMVYISEFYERTEAIVFDEFGHLLTLRAKVGSGTPSLSEASGQYAQEQRAEVMVAPDRSEDEQG